MKFEELLIYNLLVEAFQDEDILFSESIQMSKALQEIITDKRLVVPEEVKGISKLDLKDEKVLNVDDGRKVQEIKIGKVLQRIWPDMGTKEMNEIIGKIKAKLSEHAITFTIEDKVSKWYKSGACGELKTCMTDKTDLVKFYDTQDSIKIVIAWRNKTPIGRALLWHNVEGAGSKGIYMDRVYPPDNNEIVEAFRTHAKKNGWLVYGNRSNVVVYNLENTDKIDFIPYLDTFIVGNNKQLADHSTGLKYVTYQLNDTLGVKFSSKIIWKSGFWEHGIWYDGTWENGTWKGGFWEYGIWEDGTWKNGIWKNGTWWNGTWEDGTWEKGTWKGGWWNGGIWKDGTWKSGTWQNGTWEDGTWENGTWKDGTWKSGKWLNGQIYDPKKIGNFKPDWKWRGAYVESPINPKEYFAK